MILSDRTIKDIILNKGVYLVNPFNPDHLQPCSIDLHLDNELKTIDGKTINIKDDSYHLKPNEFILGSTIEEVHIPNDIVGHLDGRSSIARLGLLVHCTAGYIDSGYKGNITLEIYNCSNKDFELFYGDSICQIVYETLTTPVDRPYGSEGLGSKYQNSKGVVNSKL